MKFAIFFAVLLMSASLGYAGPFSYGACQSGCNAVVVACYAAGGLTFGTGKKKNSVELAAL
jgi:hypothetical protein